MPDQPGFLTAADQAFLRGEQAYDSKQGRYQRQQSIRERTRQAFHDFVLLYDELDETEREKIFAPLVDGLYHPDASPNSNAEPPEDYQTAVRLKGGLQATIAFIYLGLWPTVVPFDDLVTAAVFQSEKERHNRFVDVTVSIEETEPFGAIESAISKLEVGAVDELAYTEMQLLLAFVQHPETYPDTDARTEAIDRLNDLEMFSIADPGPDSDQ